MNASIASAALLLVAFGASAAEPQVLLINGTITDVWPESLPNTSEIAPGQSGRVNASQVKWLRFGQEAHRYNSQVLARAVARSKESLVVQAHSDGCLYRLPSAASSPVSVLPKQPRGFPLCPVQRVDLT